MGRHEQREQLFKLLFRIEFNTMEEMPQQIQLFFQDDEIKFTEKTMEAIHKKHELLQEKHVQIDALINEKAEGWNIERMGKVELTVLRIAVYEILFDEEIPNTVAINEAVEIAKQYGQETSGGFVNAILAKFMK